MHVLLFSRELFVRRQKRVVREQALANVPDIGYLVIRSWVHCRLRPTAVDAVHWAHCMPLLAEETLAAMHQALASSMYGPRDPESKPARFIQHVLNLPRQSA